MRAARVERRALSALSRQQVSRQAVGIGERIPLRVTATRTLLRSFSLFRSPFAFLFLLFLLAYPLLQMGAKDSFRMLGFSISKCPSIVKASRSKHPAFHDSILNDNSFWNNKL